MLPKTFSQKKEGLKLFNICQPFQDLALFLLLQLFHLRRESILKIVTFVYDDAIKDFITYILIDV